jgi:hypothetical protein
VIGDIDAAAKNDEHPRSAKLGPRPCRPDIGADGPALRANHARLERLHREVAGQMVDFMTVFVPALMTDDLKRPHAVLAHVGEVDRLDRITRAGAAYAIWHSASLAVGRLPAFRLCQCLPGLKARQKPLRFR